MKRTLSFLLSLVMVIGIFAILPVNANSAFSGACGENLTWTLNDYGVLTISGTGDMYDYHSDDSYYSNKRPWYIYCYDINTVVIEDGVTSVGSYAFFDCTSLSSLTIPDSITSIGDSAFFGCTKLRSITIPDSVTLIEYQAFYNTGYYNNSSNWVNGVLYMGNHLIWANNDLNGAYTINSGTITICDYAFENCKELTSVTIPDSVTRIGVNAFKGCEKLSSVTIPDSVTIIGNYAFQGCESLTAITIPDSVQKIGHGAFFYTGYYDDPSNWENNVIYINNHLIVAKYALPGSYTVKPGTKTIADYAFYNCDKLTSVTISSSVRSIGDMAFWDCDQLASVVIGAGVQDVGEKAFSDCDRLTSISVPSGVRSIGERAFYDCDRLNSITLPDTIERIGSGAFDETAFYDNENNWENNMLYINNHLVKVRTGYDYSRTFTIKDGTKTIADYAFSMLVFVEVPPDYNYEPRNSVKDTITIVERPSVILAENAIIIPASVTNIGYSALYFGTTLSIHNVFYKGTKAQWEKINIKGGNKDLLNAKIHYNTTDHVAGEWIIDQKATVDAPGSAHSVCVYCDKTLKYGTISQLKCSAPGLKSVSNTSGGVKITWGSVKGADSYAVMRKTGNGKWSVIAEFVTATTYTDTTPKNGTTYKYTVKAKNEAGYSKYNTTGISVKKLAVPTKITVANAKTGITVKWGKVTGSTGYYVMRKTGKGSWKKIATVKGTTYTDKTAKAGVNYKYTIKAYCGSDISAYNTSGVAVKRLVAPKISSAVSNREGILIKWNKITGASGYRVYRKATSGDWKKIATVKGNAKIKYLDENPRKGVNYQYYVKAYDGKSISVNSNTYKVKCKY